MNSNIKTLVFISVAFILGIFLGTLIPSNQQKDKAEEVYAIYDGEKIKASDVNASIQGDLDQLEKNIYQIKRRATEEYIKNKVSTQIEKDHTLPELQNINISPGELSAFLQERNIDSKKISQAQMNDIVANMKMEKQKLIARKSGEEKIKKSPIEWKLSMPAEPVFALKKATLAPSHSQSPAVEVFYIGNFHCPGCKEAEQRLVQLKEKYKNKIRVIYRFSLQEPDNSIVRAAAEASYCANDQGQFWLYRDHLAQLDHILETQTLLSSAETLKLNSDEFKNCLTGRKYKTLLDQEMDEIVQLKIDLIPSFVIDGRLRSATQTIDELSVLVDQAL